MLGEVGESVLFSNKQTNKQTHKQTNKQTKHKKGFGVGTGLELAPEYILILKQMSKKLIYTQAFKWRVLKVKEVLEIVMILISCL